MVTPEGKKPRSGYRVFRRDGVRCLNCGHTVPPTAVLSRDRPKGEGDHVARCSCGAETIFNLEE